MKSFEATGFTWKNVTPRGTIICNFKAALAKNAGKMDFEKHKCRKQMYILRTWAVQRIEAFMECNENECK